MDPGKIGKDSRALSGLNQCPENKDPQEASKERFSGDCKTSG